MDFYKHFGHDAQVRRSQAAEHVEFYDVSNHGGHHHHHPPSPQEWISSRPRHLHPPPINQHTQSKHGWIANTEKLHQNDFRRYEQSHYNRPPKSPIRTRSPVPCQENYNNFGEAPQRGAMPKSPWENQVGDLQGPYSQNGDPSRSPPRGARKRSTLLRQRSIPPPSPQTNASSRAMHPPPASRAQTAGPSVPPPPANTNPAKGEFRVSRVDGWTRFLAYEGCFQVCLKAGAEGHDDANFFLSRGCDVLKKTLSVDRMLLNSDEVLASGQYGCTPVIMWDDASNTIGLQGDAQPSPPIPRSPPQSVRWAPNEPAYYRSVSVLRVRFDKFVEGDGKKSVLRRLRRKASRKGNGDDSVCIHNPKSGKFFHTFLDGAGNFKGCTHGGEVAFSEDQLDAPISLSFFRNQDHVATGLLYLSSVFENENRPCTSCPMPSPSIGSCNRDDPFKNLGCIPFLRPSEQRSTSPYSVHHGRMRSRRSDPFMDEQAPFQLQHYGHPVQLYSAQNGAPFGTVVLNLEEVFEEETVRETRQDIMPMHEPPPREPPGMEAPTRGNIRVSSFMAYEYLLAAALEEQGCCSGKLRVDGPWKWLLEEFADLYAIRPAYRILTHLKWVMGRNVRTCTAKCLELVLEEYCSLMQEKDEMGLHEQDAASMERVAKEIKELLAKVFENYYALSDMSEAGIMEGSLHQQESPPVALEPAVFLFGRLFNKESAEDQLWLKERFRTAAKKKFQRLQCSCDDESCPNGREPPAECVSRPPSRAQYGRQAFPPPSPVPNAQVSEASKLQQYKRLEALAMALRNDLDYDIKIHEASVLPHSLNLPSVTATIFCQELVGKLGEVLRTIPPQYPSPEVIDMVVGVGRLEDYLSRHKLRPPNDDPGYLNARELFTWFVRDWLQSSQESLVAHCRTLENRLPLHSPAPHGRPMTGLDAEAEFGEVSPLVSEMLKLIDEEMRKFERLVVYWERFGPHLESCISVVIRSLVAAVSRQCGMTLQTPSPGMDEYRHESYYSRPITPNCSPAPRTYSRPRSPTKLPSAGRHGVWQWQNTHSVTHMQGNGRGRLGVTRREAILLNSLRRLLGEVPELEQTLSRWCGHKEGHEHRSCVEIEDDDKSMPEHVGAQFAQVVKELRTEYSNATVFCCERMARCITANPSNMIANILHHHNGSQDRHSQSDVTMRMEPLLRTLDQTTGSLQRALDARVFVTLIRGLWEHISDDLYIFVENLQEGRDHKGAWKSRENAQTVLRSLNGWFRETLTRCMEHDITEKDLELPLHANLTQKLLAENSSAVNMSYTVF